MAGYAAKGPQVCWQVRQRRVVELVVAGRWTVLRQVDGWAEVLQVLQVRERAWAERSVVSVVVAVVVVVE